MKLKFLILCIVSCFVFSCRAQNVLLFSDARSAALGDLYSLTTGWWSCLSNPAGLAMETSTGCGLNYSNYYGIPETTSGALAVNLSVKPGKLGIGFLSSGFAAINESRAVLAYARPIGRKLRAGIGINWLRYTQPDDYTDLYTWVPSVGIQWLPGQNWITGITILNPAKQQYIPSGYRKVTSCIMTGTGYRPSEDILINFEMQMLTGLPVRYALGIEASMASAFALRMAISRQYHFMYSAGLGYSKNSIFMDLAVNHHPVLGFSPSLALSFKF